MHILFAPYEVSLPQNGKGLQSQQQPPPPQPTPATATDPSPPESPSSTPYLPRPLAFPRPSPNLIPSCDLQSTLSIANTSTIAGAVLHLARIEAEGNTQSRPHRRAVRSAAQALRSPFGFALAAAVLASVIGCGNTYRPVVSAINPVGPAAQPRSSPWSSPPPARPPIPPPVWSPSSTSPATPSSSPPTSASTPTTSILNSGGNTGLHAQQRPHPHHLRHQHLAPAKPGPADHPSPRRQPRQHLSRGRQHLRHRPRPATPSPSSPASPSTLQQELASTRPSRRST